MPASPLQNRADEPFRTGKIRSFRVPHLRPVIERIEDRLRRFPPFHLHRVHPDVLRHEQWDVRQLGGDDQLDLCRRGLQCLGCFRAQPGAVGVVELRDGGVLPVGEGDAPGGGETEGGVDRVLPEPLVDETRRAGGDGLVEALEGQDRSQLKENPNGPEVIAQTGGDLFVDRVVLNPKTKEVTHIVVRKGFLFLEDKIVPLSLIASSTEEGVALRPNAGDLESLPPFEETHYVSADDLEARDAASTAEPLYWYPPMGGWLGYSEFGYGYPPPYPSETQQNIPPDTVALREGALVITADGQQVGTVERVFTDSQTDRATYFLMSQGLFFKERKLIPVTWIRTINENEIHLSVGAVTLDGLREYQTN